jgi:hypothetical protein
MILNIQTSVGELIDKITILEIKLEKITDKDKLSNIKCEYDALMTVYESEVVESSKILELRNGLKKTNVEIWDIEDNIRNCERSSSFGQEFIDIARSVYKTNDKRANLKREINVLFNSNIIEEKSYNPY